MKQVILTLLVIIPIVTFSQENTTYEYLTIVKYSTKLRITVGTESYEEIKVKDEVQSNTYDLTPVHAKIEEFESAGWELLSYDGEWSGAQSSFLTYTVVMRRKK